MSAISPHSNRYADVLQSLDIFWRFITGDDDLLSGNMKMVECMEKFFLCTFFSDDKLDIVNEQNIIISVFFTECRHRKFISVFTYFQSID